jgi:hypothetical protein
MTNNNLPERSLFRTSSNLKSAQESRFVALPTLRTGSREPNIADCVKIQL